MKTMTSGAAWEASGWDPMIAEDPTAMRAPAKCPVTAARRTPAAAKTGR